jgi:hypothetical protein
VATQKQHRPHLALRVQPVLRNPDEKLVDSHQSPDRLLLVVEGRVLLLVCLLQEFGEFVRGPARRRGIGPGDGRRSRGRLGSGV